VIDAIRTVLAAASWVLLALATVGSAWCAYQAAQWNGHEALKMAKASAAQFNSIRKLSVVSRNMMIDVATFLDHMAAESHDDAARARYLREHARRELRPALESWIADAAGNPDAPSPFARPEYRLAEEEEAKVFDATPPRWSASRDVAVGGPPSPQGAATPPPAGQAPRAPVSPSIATHP
jgi:hypothetical protein